MRTSSRLLRSWTRVVRPSVKEASETYERAMRNVASLGLGVCPVCRTLIKSSFRDCVACHNQPENYIDLVVPITYSENLGQMHQVLRGYKDGMPGPQKFMTVRLAAILWRFLEAHEPCIVRQAGVDFDLATTVPSSTPQGDDERTNLRRAVTLAQPITARFERILVATGDVSDGRHFDVARYRCDRVLTGQNILLIDDTWTTGGHAQSAAYALKDAGAQVVVLVAVGRHVHRDWPLDGGRVSVGEFLDKLPPFDWDTCTVHAD